MSPSTTCYRCALRLQRAAQAETRQISHRTFSSTANRPKSLPAFTETSTDHLNDVLSTIREKHFIPAYLRTRERNLTTKQKYRQQLIDNPVTTTAGGEEVDLKPLNIFKDIPKRQKLIKAAIDAIVQSDDAKDWTNLPALLHGLNEGLKKPAETPLMEKIIRRSVQHDRNQFGVIIQCIQQREKTGMTLANESILRTVLVTLHLLAQKGNWSGVSKALRDANAIALQLELEGHGGGARLVTDDPRTTPEVLGVFLELAAVYVAKHVDGKDTEGLVKAHAERLVSSLKSRGVPDIGEEVEKTGPAWSMLATIPTWYGLTLAEKILSTGMPDPKFSQGVMADYGAKLSRMAVELEASQPEPNTYRAQALKSWKACSLDVLFGAQKK